MSIEVGIALIIIMLLLRAYYDDNIRNVFERRYRMEYLSGRQELRREESVQIMLKYPHLPYNDIDNVLTFIGNTLHVNPNLLRPSDKLSDLRGIKYHILEGDSEIDYLEDIIKEYQSRYCISDNVYMEIIGVKHIDHATIGDIFIIIDTMYKYQHNK